MKRLLITFALFFCAKVQAQLYTSPGAVLHLADSAVFTVADSSVYLNNNITGSNGGRLMLKGSSIQYLNNNGYSVYGLDVNNTVGISLTGNTEINGLLYFTNGKLKINGQTLTLSGNLLGSSATNALEGSNTSNLIVSGNLGSSLYFSQITDASRSTIAGTNALANLSLSSGSNVQLGNKLNLFGVLTPALGSTLNTGDGLLVMRNYSTGAARVADLSAGAGTLEGTVISEIYMNKQGRAWRLLTTPLSNEGLSSGNTINENWQSNFGYDANYGTNIYGPGTGTGLDVPYRSNYSLLSWNIDSLTVGAWSGVYNTNSNVLFNTNSTTGTIPANKNYFLFVRGDRNVAWNNTTFVPTTLAAKGKIQTGTKTYTFANKNGRYAVIGNPFISPVNATTLTYNNIGGSNAIYVWDPSLGSNGLGGWVTLNTINSYSSGSSNVTSNMQTGEAVMVLINNNNSSVTFTESNKNSGFNNAVTGAGNHLQDNFRAKLTAVNTNGTKTALDELFVAFKNGFNSAIVKSEDAEKVLNSGENISSKRNGSLIAVEARPYIQNSDTVFIELTNCKTGINYEFGFDPQNFDATVTEAKIIDKFMGTQTPINLQTNTNIGFTISSATGSNATDRFMIVFKGTGNLPAKGLSVMAEKLETTARVTWEATNEFGVKNYELEHSSNATNFANINTQTAKNGNITNSYNYIDNNPVNGLNYYRVKATDVNDVVRYSSVVTINFKPQTANQIIVYPNPVKGNQIGLQLQGLVKGEYTARLFNTAGQLVWQQNMSIQAQNLSTVIDVKSKLAAGSYNLQFVNNFGNNSYNKTILVVE